MATEKKQPKETPGGRFWNYGPGGKVKEVKKPPTQQEIAKAKKLYGPKKNKATL